MSLIKHKALSIILILICYTFTIYLLSPAAYAQENKVCCEKTLDGSFCTYTTQDKCDTSYRATNQPVPCEQTAYCQLGCCQTAEGSCLKSVSHATCSNETGTTWTADPLCQYSECAKGCCELGTECDYTTEKQCEAKQEIFPNATYAFSAVESELECFDLCLAKDYGCCVEEDYTCSYGPRDSCISAALTNTTSRVGFHLGTFCSDPELNQNDDTSCNCEPHKAKRCVGDRVYWFDSCNSQEEEFQYCDYEQDLICVEEEDGEAYCKSTNCQSTQSFSGNPETGGVRKNGESWCVYDGTVGGGADLVGSRHYRHICVDGVELSEPCRDFREEFCVQADITGSEKGDYREATCKNNRWDDCATTCNTAKDETKPKKYFKAMQEDKACCENFDLRDCIWVDGGIQTIEEAKDTKIYEFGDDIQKTRGEVGQCLPLIAPGFAHWTGTENEGEEENKGSSQSEGASTCSVAQKSCTVVWRKKSGFDDWELVGGKDCIKGAGHDFAQGFNSYCRSLGDCGAHYNIAGRITYDGYACSSDEGGCSGVGEHGDHFDIDKPAAGSFVDYIDAGKGIYLGTINQNDFHTGFQAALNYAPAAVISLAVTYAALSLAVEGGAMGALGSIIGSALSGSSQVFAGSASAVGWAGGGAAGSAAATAAALVAWVAIIILAVIILIYVFGADTEEFTVDLTCNPWQAPSGGSDCHLCQQDFKECSEYRCKSLGTSCMLINEDTPLSDCIDGNPNDANSPIITHDEDALTAGYSISTTNVGYKIIPDIEAYTPITFGIKTNEPAKCKINVDHTSSFDDMPSLFIGSAYYTQEKNITLNPEANQTYNYYIRCEDAAGNANGAEYLIEFQTEAGPDFTPPVIAFTDPGTASYIANDVNTTLLTVYTNERADCKWDLEDKEFELMASNMSCIHPKSTNSLTMNYFTCDTTLTNITLGKNDYYLRCKDQSENVNSESTNLVLTGTHALEIVSTSPKNVNYENDLTLEIQTAKGAEGGKAECYFSETETVSIGNMVKFFETGSSIHKQNLQDLARDDYTYWVICEDLAFNRANATIEFTVDKDLTAPKVRKLSRDQTHLSFVTNEPSTCKYQDTRFTWDQGTLMEGINISEHSLTIVNATYFILCQDNYGNLGQNPIIVNV